MDMNGKYMSIAAYFNVHGIKVVKPTQEEMREVKPWVEEIKMQLLSDRLEGKVIQWNEQWENFEKWKNQTLGIPEHMQGKPQDPRLNK